MESRIKNKLTITWDQLYRKSIIVISREEYSCPIMQMLSCTKTTLTMFVNLALVLCYCINDKLFGYSTLYSLTYLYYTCHNLPSKSGRHDSRLAVEDIFRGVLLKLSIPHQCHSIRIVRRVFIVVVTGSNIQILYTLLSL